jgi:peroxiredoxin
VRWTPPPAPAWKLEGGEGFQSLAGYQGRAVLVVFYLGSGCKHCIEQLNLLSEASGDFAAAGISLVAVGTETADALRKTTVQAKNREGFGFPILADPKQKVFKAYHCIDEFEGEPLHGAFLIDGAGFIRWQEISLEPFREIPWLIKEAKRLLPLPVRKGGEKGVRGEGAKEADAAQPRRGDIGQPRATPGDGVEKTSGALKGRILAGSVVWDAPSAELTGRPDSVSGKLAKNAPRCSMVAMPGGQSKTRSPSGDAQRIPSFSVGTGACDLCIGAACPGK